MCNLYRMTRTVDEVAALFDAGIGQAGNAGGEVFPGYPAMVVAGGEVRSMVWGFPFATRGKSGKMLKPRPVNNARTDKLAGGFWKPSFVARRCLIPVDAFAEAEGAKGTKTRTWFSDPGGELLALAGIWRRSDEWGEVFSMIMTGANETVAPVHDRMPVILPVDAREAWLAGTPDEAFALCRPFPGDLARDATRDPWVQRKAAGAG
ncbi:MAG: SOS response-associated peptidase family protein [Alteraurantiacibacter sp.]